MAKAKQNMNLKIQMLAGKEAKTFFERFYKNIPSLVVKSSQITNLSICIELDNEMTHK